MPRTNPVPQSEKEIGARLRAFRLENRIEQVEFARALEIDGRALGAYERGQIPLPYYVARRLCEKFNVNPDWLATGRHLKKALYARDVMEHPNIPAKVRFSDAYDRFLKQSLPDDLDSVLKDGVVNIGVPARQYLKLFENSKSYGTAAARVFEAFVKDCVHPLSAIDQSIFFGEMTDFLTKFVAWKKADEERGRAGRDRTLSEN